MIFDSLSVIIPLIIIVLLLVSMIKILREYERGVIFMLGRFWGRQGSRFDHRHPRAAADASG